MKTASFLLLFLLFSARCVAQKPKVGIINRDSLLQLIPGYVVANASYKEKKDGIAGERQHIKAYLDEKISTYDSMHTQWSPLICSLKQKEIEDYKQTLLRFDEFAEEYVLYDSLRVAAFQYELNEAAEAVCRKKKCTLAASPDRNSVAVIDLNADVASALKTYAQLHADPKKIGYVNKDSLLRLYFPEYRETKERTDQAMGRYYTSFSIVTETEYDPYHDSDSTKEAAAVIDSLLKSDSVICAPYEKKFNEAWTAAMKQRKVFYIYDSAVANKVWPEKDVQFVDMNSDLAKRLNASRKK